MTHHGVSIRKVESRSVLILVMINARLIGKLRSMSSLSFMVLDRPEKFLCDEQ